MTRHDADGSEFLFHASRASRLQEIRQRGLEPNTNREPTFDGYPINGRLYLSARKEGAEFYARTISRHFEQDAVILRLPASAISRVFPDDFGNIGDFWTDESVAPDVIDTLSPDGIWQKLEIMDEHLSKTAEPCMIHVGPLSVFSYPDRIDITDDGRAVEKNDYGNMVARLVLQDKNIIDAATPGVAKYTDEVLTVVNQLELQVVGRAKQIFSFHGLLFENGSCFHRDEGYRVPVL